MGRLSTAVQYLVIANAIVFVITLVRPDLHEPMVEWFACWFPRNEHFGVWQVVTYMFMHGGIGHIFFNMFALVSFGQVLERQWGVGKFLIFYFLCGIGAAVVDMGVNWLQFQSSFNRLTDAGVPALSIQTLLETNQFDQPITSLAIKASLIDIYRLYHGHVVGASGAIYGVLVAFGLLYPNAKLGLLFVPVPIAAKYFIPIVLALDLLGGVTGFSLFGGAVAHFAHLGGALIGFLLMWYWRNQARREVADNPPDLWRQT